MLIRLRSARTEIKSKNQPASRWEMKQAEGRKRDKESSFSVMGDFLCLEIEID